MDNRRVKANQIFKKMWTTQSYRGEFTNVITTTIKQTT